MQWGAQNIIAIYMRVYIYLENKQFFLKTSYYIFLTIMLITDYIHSVVLDLNMSSSTSLLLFRAAGLKSLQSALCASLSWCITLLQPSTPNTSWSTSSTLTGSTSAPEMRPATSISWRTWRVSSNLIFRPFLWVNTTVISDQSSHPLYPKCSMLFMLLFLVWDLIFHDALVPNYSVSLVKPEEVCYSHSQPKCFENHISETNNMGLKQSQSKCAFFFFSVSLQPVSSTERPTSVTRNALRKDSRASHPPCLTAALQLKQTQPGQKMMMRMMMMRRRRKDILSQVSWKENNGCLSRLIKTA